MVFSHICCNKTLFSDAQKCCQKLDAIIDIVGELADIWKALSYYFFCGTANRIIHPALT